MEKVVLKVPASTANLGPGFDSLGANGRILCECVVWMKEPHIGHAIWRHGLTKGKICFTRA